MEEWMLAARGTEVRRFAWGEEFPDCTRHWRSEFAPGACCTEGCPPAKLGAFPNAASPSGLLDVLTTVAELVGGYTSSTKPICQNAKAGCMVTGLVPGSMDMLRRTPSDDYTIDDAHFIRAAGFRCVHAGGTP
jgi:formylglycine-generating enzyme required for sulfatase activity